MNNSQVAHLWANQSRKSARGSSFYFDGPTIYSYGPHFPVATIATRKGKRAFLFNNDNYSISTCKHQRHARRAVYGLDALTFTVQMGGSAGLGQDHKRNREDYKARIADAVSKAAAARSHADLHIETAERLTTEANAYAEFFGLSWRLKAPDFSPEFLAKVKADNAKRAAAKAQKTIAEKAWAALIASQAIKEWREGAPGSLSWNVQSALPGALLRVRELDSGDARLIVETSRGATVPAADARRAILFVAGIRKRGEPWHRNGERFAVGDFQLDRVSATGDVNAGCHFIQWGEVARLASDLGVST